MPILIIIGIVAALIAFCCLCYYGGVIGSLSQQKGEAVKAILIFIITITVTYSYAGWGDELLKGIIEGAVEGLEEEIADKADNVKYYDYDNRNKELTKAQTKG